VTSKEFYYLCFTGEDGRVVGLLDDNEIQKGYRDHQKDAHKEPLEVNNNNSLPSILPVHIHIYAQI
jgi:hypothetical protein